MEEEAHLQNSSSTSSSILSRLIFVVVIVIISIWATHEASKGFQITVLNDVKDTVQGRRFHLLFASNDRATRFLLNASDFAQRLLYPDDRHPIKPVRRVTLRLAACNSTSVSSLGEHDFDIRLTSAVMDGADVGRTVASALQRAMARVWVWDGPAALVDGLVESVAAMAGMPECCGTCGMGHVALARFLQHCERVERGYLARLNLALHVGRVGKALGECASYHLAAIRILNSSGAASASA